VTDGKIYLGNAHFTDDGLPVPPGDVSITWTCIDYPDGASVTFDDANELNTYVRNLTVPTGAAPNDPYVLQLDVDDGDQNAAVTTNIYVINYAPVVYAGADKAITLPYQTEVHLSDASVSDNTLPIPPNSLTIEWSCVSCPGSVTFDPPNEPNTWVRNFSAPGTYTLRLDANDGDLSAYDDVNIVVDQEFTVEAGPDKTIELPVHKATLYGAYISGISGGANVTWSAISCSPGANLDAVGFDNNTPEPSNVVTAVTLPIVEGDYVLQLRVESGQTEKADSVKVTIGQGPGADYHDPPEVEAGDYNAVTLGDILDLNDAWVADDGKPYGLVTTGWSMVYGPAGGTVDFDDPSFVQTSVEFRLPGTYTLMHVNAAGLGW
ncbi:MAG: PKD domain-containing protein, partial [Planctomycetota bacterium]